MPTLPRDLLNALVNGQFGDPFGILGPHDTPQGRVVRTFQPTAREVHLLDAQGRDLGVLAQLHSQGVFGGPLPTESYKLQLFLDDDTVQTIADPYAFPSVLGDLDHHLFSEGRHYNLWHKLGAHMAEINGVAGVLFAVWAPNARRVSVVGEFNHWDGRVHIMRFHPNSGVWELFIPGVALGALYKYEILGRNGQLLPLKTDPLGFYFEGGPHFASRVYADQYAWRDEAWLAQRSCKQALDAPMSIYEVHLGSWRRVPEAHNRYLTYRELATHLVEYVTDLGFTHVELLPITEHPFDGSWGYQPIGLFAPTQRLGSPADFKFLVDALHQANIGVILDWVPAHFPRDAFGLAEFDGTHLYEHADPRQGSHQDWGTLIYNYGRHEVANYLISNALFWITEFHIDALRVDAVASMLYLDYSRPSTEWIPNRYGGRENLEALAFLRHLNEAVHATGAMTIAEESTAWPMVSRPTYVGGLGFSYKWDLGWMHDTLDYMGCDPLYRRYEHHKMTFGMWYAHSEHFILALSHDEVVHGKRSLLDKMPGDCWQKFANLRAYYGFLYGHPGKKLLFMGNEFAQGREWNYDTSLDWHLLDLDWHRGVLSWVRDLNQAYRHYAPCYEGDHDPERFCWLDCHDAQNSVLSWARRDQRGQWMVGIGNFTPQVRHHYRIPMPQDGPYVEWLNSDRKVYGGSGVENGELMAHHGELLLTLPPLSVLWLRSREGTGDNL